MIEGIENAYPNYGLPKQKKNPLPDRKHVLSAIMNKLLIGTAKRLPLEGKLSGAEPKKIKEQKPIRA